MIVERNHELVANQIPEQVVLIVPDGSQVQRRRVAFRPKVVHELSIGCEIPLSSFTEVITQLIIHKPLRYGWGLGHSGVGLEHAVFQYQRGQAKMKQ